MSAPSRTVPPWGRGHAAGLPYHARLLADARRVAAYEQALRRLVRSGDRVLDLGTGAGLLAVLAARLGASAVHAVESMPVAGLAEALVARHGVGDVVRVHRGDITAMAPAGEVDLVVGDFMGRFVIDDGMLWALDAARGWAAPGARWCPSALRLLVAPVAMGWFEPLDVFEAGLLGLDLSPGAGAALHGTYGAELTPEALLAEPAEAHRMAPPDRDGPIDAALRFDIERAGRLRGLAGWFEATLAPGVELRTGPGVSTHWQQALFPLPATPVEPGDRVEVRLRVAAEDPRLVFAWQGVIARPGRGDVAFDLDSVPRWGGPGEAPPAPWPPAPDAAEASNEAGAEAWRAGDLPAAIAAFERATAALRPDADPGFAAGVYENLGMARVLAGRPAPAVAPLLRALDGDEVSREQAARFLVDAWMQLGRVAEGEALRRRYEAAFGPHPSGWSRRDRRPEASD